MARLVIGYDGSEAARGAVRFAARSLHAEEALIVNVFPDVSLPALDAVGAGPPPMPAPDSAQLERGARATAEEGADLARVEGLTATTAIRRGGGAGDVARALHDVAEAYGADVLVVGHRTVSRLESALLGSVAVTAVRDERCPVLVVPA
jgi:nucleotide-binding universal stress UspA family protein